MKNFFEKKLFFLIFLFLVSSSFLLHAQQEKDPLASVQVDIEIVDATYGKLDNKIRSGENVHFINKATKAPLYIKKDGWAYLTHIRKYSPFPGSIFTIEKVGGKDGDTINKGDIITLKTHAPFAGNIPYLGVKQRAGWALGLGGIPVWFGHLDSKKSDPICQWQISGQVFEGGEIKLKSLKSKYFLYDSVSAAKKAPVIGIGKYASSSFFIYHVLKPQKTQKQLVTKEVKGMPLVPFLSGLIKGINGIKDISEGIVLEEEFNEIFSDLGLKPPTKIWKQLTVTYKLDREEYIHTFLESDKKIQIPTQEELLEAKKIVKARQDAAKDLEELGFRQISGRAVKIATEAGLTFAIGDDGTLYQLQENKWEEIGPKKFSDVAIGIDSTVFLIGKDKKLYTQKTQEGKFELINISPNPVFLAVSLVNKDDIWVITTDGKVQKFNFQTKQLTSVAGVALSQISAGPGKVLGVTAAGDLYEWIGGTSYDNPQGWIPIPSEKLKQIEVGKEIWGVEIEGRKVFERVDNRWREIGPARHFTYVTISSRGDFFGLVPEFPPLSGGHAIFCKTTNLQTLNSPFALKTFYHSYLSVGPDGILSAATTWPESFTFVDPQNENSRSPLAFGQNVALKSLVTGKYVKITKDETGKPVISANESTLANATIFKLINQLNPQATSELEIGIDIPINLEVDGLQLGATKATEEVFVDDQKGTLEKKWRIESVE